MGNLLQERFLIGDEVMTDFCPVIWPEVPTPKNQQNCKECGLYTHGSRMVWGEGNPDAPIMIVLDNPGSREDREGNSFVCGTRQTLQRAANEVQLHMDDLYVTYILKRRPTRKYKKDETRQTCMLHLNQQLRTNNPKFIFCMGNVAVQSFFNEPEATVKSLRGEWHDVGGLKTTVAYHPLAVRRRPNLWNTFLDDWQFVAKQYHTL